MLLLLCSQANPYQITLCKRYKDCSCVFYYFAKNLLMKSLLTSNLQVVHGSSQGHLPVYQVFMHDAQQMSWVDMQLQADCPRTRCHSRGCFGIFQSKGKSIPGKPYTDIARAAFKGPSLITQRYDLT